MPDRVEFPGGFASRMKKNLGEAEWKAFEEAHQSPSPTGIRINPFKTKRKEFPQVPWSAFGYLLPSRPIFTLDPSFHAGAYYVQEPSSMFLEQVVKQCADLRRPLDVLDLCASPGGKSTHLLSLLHPESLLVANEVIRSRATVLSESIQKWGTPNVVVTNNDPKQFQKLTGFFDMVLVDAPCSGEGLFRKDPEAMKEWSPENIHLCTLRQRRILEDVWPSLKKEGLLIYCTCTFTEAENEENLKWLATQHDLEFLPLTLDAKWGIQTIHHQNVIGYRFLPHHTPGEGFFISVIRKLSDEAVTRHDRKKTSISRSPYDVSEWVKENDAFEFEEQHGSIGMHLKAHSSRIKLLSQSLSIITKGTKVAEKKNSKLIPDHAIALSTALRSEYFNTIHLDKDGALAFLRKNSFPFPPTNRGYALICHDGLSLGWVNVLENRLNNLYPASWRIRMGS
jgi:16S rRNA C967 or C1407 C5-methylase (RsmB/RsmF family)/NOL1/NOP2/fmu family ribosome biogenesis protein